MGGWTTVTAPTCTTAGSESRSCSRCSTTETSTIAALGHSYGAWAETKKASCGVKGVESRTCASCGNTETRDIDTLAHSWTSWVKTTEPTALRVGTETRTCLNCGEKETRPVAATGSDVTGGGSDAPPHAVIIDDSAVSISDDVFLDIILNDDNPVFDLTSGSDIEGTVISAEILQAIREADVEVTVILDSGIIIKIDPATITDDAVDFDLNIVIDILSRATTIDTAVTSAKLSANSIVLIPNMKGAFGFEVTVIIPAQLLEDAGIKGDNLTLWYVDELNTIVTDYGKVKRNADGSIQVSISKASYYVISEEAPEVNVLSSDGNNPKTVAVMGFTSALIFAGAMAISKKRRISNGAIKG